MDGEREDGGGAGVGGAEGQESTWKAEVENVASRRGVGGGVEGLDGLAGRRLVFVLVMDRSLIEV